VDFHQPGSPWEAQVASALNKRASSLFLAVKLLGQRKIKHQRGEGGVWKTLGPHAQARL